MAGYLESKLDATASASFTQITLWANDLVRYPDGYLAALNEVRAAGLQVTLFRSCATTKGYPGRCTATTSRP